MKANLRNVQKYRYYSEEFKQQLVQEFESGRYSIGQLEKLYGIRHQLIYRWVYKYSQFNEKGYRIVEHQASSSKKINELQSRIQELEALVGRKQITIEYLEKMIDLAQGELGIDIKKNYNTLPYSGSKNTNRKGDSV
uniref:Transposase n=1 Tax=Roseihalotalea indica TaxID=2867963 RepID=A0AA49GQJ8_9BACT|nr:transposase [Tunicatimonas sp. TK19036]